MITETQRAYWNKWAPYDGIYGIGDQLKLMKTVVRGTWDFAVQGGAVSTINLLDQVGNPIVIPDKAIVTQVYTDEVTNVTTSASGTLSLGLNTTVDLLAATAAATFAGIQAGIPTGTGASMVKATADRTLVCAIATGALTAGKINVFVEYVQST